MTIKLGRIYLVMFSICAILLTQQTTTIAQKITIENSYQQKISAAVSNLGPVPSPLTRSKIRSPG